MYLPIVKTVRGEVACMICQGYCCKRVPGESMPDRWLANGSLDGRLVLRALLSKKWTIAFWQGDPRYPDINKLGKVAYLRPMHQNSRAVFDDSYSTGTCCFWTPNGCQLVGSDRPEGCDDLHAKISVLPNGKIHERECSSSDGEFFLKKVALAWIAFSEGLMEIGELALRELSS